MDLITDQLTLNNVETISIEKIPIKQKIADGGQATLYKGTYEGKPVAVKVFFEVDEKCLANEIAIMAKLNHPQIPKFYGVIKENSSFILVFDFISGKTLDEFKISSFSDTLKFSIIKDLASILEYIHSSGFIHRDLKPENLMLTDDEKIFLIDFGISKVCPQAGMFKTRVKGTLNYLAPENLDICDVGENDEIIANITSKVDVWGYGCIVSWLFSGILPWTDKYGTSASMLQSVLTKKKPFPIPSCIKDKDVIQVIKMATAVNPDERATMSEIKQYLEDSGK